MKSKIMCTMMALVVSLSAIGGEKTREREFQQAMNLVQDAINAVNLAIERSHGTIDSLEVQMKLDSIVNASIDNAVAYTVDTYSDEQSGNNKDVEYDSAAARMDRENERDFILALAGIITPFVATLLMVLLCLIYNYKKREARYKMVEKAIENNYVIPEYLANERPMMNSVGKKVLPNSTPAAGQAYVNKPKELYNNPFKWKELKSGIVMASIGVALVMACGFNFMGAICSVLIFIGVGKIVANYLEVRDMEQAYMASNNYAGNRDITNSRAETAMDINDSQSDTQNKKEAAREEQAWRYAPEEIREDIKKEEGSEKDINNSSQPPAIPEQ
ncbi:MAG: hypothetical protein J1F10_07900 [Muribaculaceae bacterium]|nr:hypothetical protein [Muribaculaceae bacterium]